MMDPSLARLGHVSHWLPFPCFLNQAGTSVLPGDWPKPLGVAASPLGGIIGVGMFIQATANENNSSLRGFPALSGLLLDFVSLLRMGRQAGGTFWLGLHLLHPP